MPFFPIDPLTKKKKELPLHQNQEKMFFEFSDSFI